MAQSTARREDEGSLAIRAAWLHYAAGLTQAEVAAKLGVPGIKAHRLITWANQNGLVKVSIEGEVAECVALEMRLAERFGLAHCTVVPDLGEKDLPLRALGLAGGDFLRREIEASRGGVIGVGHGRTLAAAVANLPRLDAGDTRFVALMGGLTRRNAANPYDVMHILSAKTGAEAYVLPVPFFANTKDDREVFLAQRGVGEVFDLALRSDLMLVGIGTADLDAVLYAARMIEAEEIGEVQARGGVGELLGHFFSREGAAIETELAARTVSPALEGIKGRRITGIAGGRNKVRAVRAVLLSGYLSGLITDERTAQALADDPF